MKKTLVVIGLLCLLTGLILSGRSLAANGLTIQREVIGSAGQVTNTSPDNYILNSTLGETIASNTLIEGSYGLGSGFWAGGGITVTGGRIVYLPVVIKES